MMANTAAKTAEETVVVDMVVDAVADTAGTMVAVVVLPVNRPLACQIPAAMMLWRKSCYTYQGCPSPQTHDTSACEYHAQLVLDCKRKLEPEKAACAATFSLPSPAMILGIIMTFPLQCTSYYACLSHHSTDSTKSACLSATPASTDMSAPLFSSSFWSCFMPATATCYAA